MRETGVEQWWEMGKGRTRQRKGITIHPSNFSAVVAPVPAPIPALSVCRLHAQMVKSQDPPHWVSRPKSRSLIGATTAEKLAGPHVGWMPILFLLRPFPVSPYCSVRVSPPIPFHTASFLLPVKSARRSEEAR